MSVLLQDILRASTLSDSLNSERKQDNTVQRDTDDSDDELVNVVSLPGTPSRTRPSSPTRLGASTRRPPGPLLIGSRKDPLKVFPTEVSQKIFARLTLPELAKCALVSKKWSRSQTINYVWFQHYRKENFHDESLPPGKWTKRESKQNWRLMHSQSLSSRSKSTNGYSGSGRSTPSLSGNQTPRELKEEKWRLEAEAAARPGKVEMRGMYKELGGRKSRGKTKLGSSGIRDKGGWSESGDW
ncbi:hypothetical protein IW261DRAFT_1551599 [Armillaria novae-zelandiae]|uniref:F-box domain-containing protein n=1 Tax=Armillaria novae-zelandiae TaxID=153914 RepID=A0AA39P788_9AGAR|nr:hypothetical protein IW261DRAFT_1551599 [Armillaria novae-zelandiae]